VTKIPSPEGLASPSPLMGEVRWGCALSPNPSHQGRGTLGNPVAVSLMPMGYTPPADWPGGLKVHNPKCKPIVNHPHWKALR